MGRPPSNGAPAFRFNPNEVAEMESILKAHNTTVPTREVLDALAEKFSSSPERSGKITVHSKQVWNWFQNRRYAIRAKEAKTPVKFERAKSPRKVGGPIALQDDSATIRNVPQTRQSIPTASAVVRGVPQAQQTIAAPSVIPAQSTGRNTSDSPQLEFEAKSARDGAWYDVAFFLSHRHLDTGDPEVLVRFSGFGSEEDEWVNVCRHVRQRSLPCESSECIVVLPGDLILCFQEGKEQALYFDAHVLDAQRRRHDVRGCRCRFLVRYDHDQSEEIVPLRKVCRRPETDYRLQQLHVANDSATQNQQKTSMDPHQTGGTLRVYPPVETLRKHNKADEQHDLATTASHVTYADVPAATISPAAYGKVPAVTISPAAYAKVPAATITPGAHVNVPAATISSVAHANSFSATISPAIHVNVAAATTNQADHANVPAATISPAVSANVCTVNTSPAVNAVPAASIFPAVNANVPAATITPAAHASVPATTITSAARASIPASTIAPPNVCVPAASITLAAAVNARVPAATVTPAASVNVPAGTITSAAHASIPATTITPTAHASVPASFITPAAHTNFPAAPITFDLHANVPAANENKVPQPEVPETVTAGNMGNSNVPGSNICYDD